MQNLIYPFQEDKLYQLRLYATGYGLMAGSRSMVNEYDFNDDNFGRILCNVYALSPMEAVFDSHEDSPAKRTARVALEYARAYNLGRKQTDNEPLPFNKLLLSVPIAMGIAAEDGEISGVIQELEAFHESGEDITV